MIYYRFLGFFPLDFLYQLVCVILYFIFVGLDFRGGVGGFFGLALLLQQVLQSQQLLLA